MRKLPTAIALFVKTPGFSPVKTRLAAGLGPQRSETFYRLSVEAIAATVGEVTRSTGADAYWAVAESEALSDPLWAQFPRIAQGQGGLGYRLDRVFSHLQDQYEVVAAIGADAPQIGTAVLEATLGTLHEARGRFSHVLGRSHDGGFYLVASRTRLSSTIWSNVSYSVETTAEELASHLAASGEILELDWQTDVDQVENLPALRSELLALRNPTRQQMAILDWLDQGFF
jgi:glycosyltransferase A (GT-A) superfamily protein (DUF2064 family)